MMCQRIRLAADLDHRFWLDIRFLGEARAQPAGQQDRFHSPTTSTSVSSLFPVFPVLTIAAATHSADAVDCNLSALCRSTQRHVTLQDCLAADASRGVQGHVCGRPLSLFSRSPNRRLAGSTPRDPIRVGHPLPEAPPVSQPVTERFLVQPAFMFCIL